MRRGFGLLQALMVIVLVSGILAIAMRYASISIKQTSDLYIKEAASLFLESAIEMSLLSISGYDRATNSNCLQNISINSSDDRFIADINITKYYLKEGSLDCGYCGTLCAPIKSDETHGMAMLEIVVQANANHPKNGGKSVRLTRRTLQRP